MGRRQTATFFLSPTRPGRKAFSFSFYFCYPLVICSAFLGKFRLSAIPQHSPPDIVFLSPLVVKQKSIHRSLLHTQASLTVFTQHPPSLPSTHNEPTTSLNYNEILYLSCSLCCRYPSPFCLCTWLRHPDRRWWYVLLNLSNHYLAAYCMFQELHTRVGLPLPIRM